MKKIKILIFLLFPFFLFSQEKEKRLALVIGNANYDKGALKNPVNDARLIVKTLDSLDFEVLEYYNLKTQRELKNAIRKFGIKRDSADVGFVYYAGHGVQIKNENYLLPTQESFDSEIDIEKSEPTFHEKVTENIEETVTEEFSAEESPTDEEFNQEVEEELLDIPTFLRRQAN